MIGETAMAIEPPRAAEGAVLQLRRDGAVRAWPAALGLPLALVGWLGSCVLLLVGKDALSKPGLDISTSTHLVSAAFAVAAATASGVVALQRRAPVWPVVAAVVGIPLGFRFETLWGMFGYGDRDGLAIALLFALFLSIVASPLLAVGATLWAASARPGKVSRAHKAWVAASAPWLAATCANGVAGVLVLLNMETHAQAARDAPHVELALLAASLLGAAALRRRGVYGARGHGPPAPCGAPKTPSNSGDTGI